MEFTLNNFFDKIYLINLDTRIDRYQECLNEFKKHNILNVKRVSAVNGNLLKNHSNRNSGNQGLLLTNIKIIKDALNKKYEKILILEDDILFIDNINKIFNKKIKYLPYNWDLLYLGGSHLFNKGKFTSISKIVDFDINENTYKKLDNELCKTTWTQTTHAVGINSKNFNMLLNIMENTQRPIDMIYCQLQQNDLNTYTFLPSLALQRPSFSDIENIYVDYNKNKKWNF